MSFFSFLFCQFEEKRITRVHYTPSLAAAAKATRAWYGQLMTLVIKTFLEITMTLYLITAVNEAETFYFDKLTVLTDEQLNVDANSSLDIDRFYRWAVKIPRFGVVMFGFYGFFQLPWNVFMYIALRTYLGVIKIKV